MEMVRSAQLTGRKCLITGASGFLGSHLAKRLYLCGAEVHGTSRSHRVSALPMAGWSQLDPLDLDAVQSVIKRLRPDVVFHFAGHATGAPDRELVIPTLNSLLVSTVNLLTAASDGACGRVVLLGSLTEPLPSQEEVVAGCPYAAAKFSSSLYGRMFYALYRVPVVIARPFQTYGPGQDPRKIIPYVTTSLLEQKPPCLSNGALEADWIYVDDVIDGLVAIIDTPNLEGKTIDLGSGQLASVRNIVEHLIALTGAEIEPLFGTLPDRPKELVRIANIRQTAVHLNWKPTVSLIQGLQQTVAWFRQQRAKAASAVCTA